ncbi:MAG TPA: outer membrane beta-barrel protein, partial [Chitinophagaceae bacterium]
TTEKQKNENSKSEETYNTSTVKENKEVISKEHMNDTPGTTENDKLKGERSAADKRDISLSKKGTDVEEKNKNANDVKKLVVSKTKIDNKPEASVAIGPSNSKKKNAIVEGKTTDSAVVNEETVTIVNQDATNQTVEKPVAAGIDSIKTHGVEPEKKSSEKKDTILRVEPAKEPAKPIVKQESSEKKWKWGLHITPGVAALNSDGLPISSQSSSSRFADMNNVSSGAGMPPARQKPADPKPGFGFQAGAFVQRQLSSRTSLSFGLQYGYYSNVLHIGTRRDSLINNNRFASALDAGANSVYNAGGETIKYTNQYHFIELPLNFQWQLNKNKTKPFVWSAGFTVGQLLSTNAIMYDTAFNGIYYQNKKLLNKTQFSLTTGFSWTIANSKTAQWKLGPVINIHLNKLVDNPLDNRGYLFFAGLRTAILFDQKNDDR